MEASLPLDTASLSLRPFAPQQLVALIEQPDRFADLAGAPAGEGLRDLLVSDEVSPKWVAGLRASAAPDPWVHGFALVHRASGSVIGSAGFKGPPDDEGVVVIAYGIVPAFEGRGYATEAADALVRFAFDRNEVRMVRAHTLPVRNASTRVLQKCGFALVGEVVDPDDGPVWRWERRREPVGR